MEISRISSNSPVVSKGNKTINTKKDFSQNFNFERERRSQEQLKKMLKDIKKKGERLVTTKCYADVAAYKRLIKDYLKSVLSYMYDIKKDVSFWQTQYFITVDTIDNKLEDLTKMLLNEQKQNLDVASTIDEITGLVIDIYK